MQVGTNNCSNRYRTLSGGIGESPSPTPSSDYEENVALATQHNCGNVVSGNNKSNMNSNNLSGSSGGSSSTTAAVKTKRSSGGAGNGIGSSSTISVHNSNSSNSSSSKSQQISQKATVHYVSLLN